MNILFLGLLNKREEVKYLITNNCEVSQKNGKVQADKVVRMLQSFHGPKGHPDYMPRNRVLQINITCEYGNTGRMVAELHHYLQENNYESHIAYSAYQSKIPEAFLIENSLERNMRIGLNKYFGKKYIHSAPGTLRLIRRIKQLSPDLIHLHNLQQNSIDYPRLLKFLKIYGAPVIYTLHDCWPFTGGCYNFAELSCEGYKTGCFEADCKLLKKDRDVCNRTTERLYQEKSDALSRLKQLQVVCLSWWQKTCAMQSFLGDFPLQVIYNGVDTNIFKPVKNKKRQELGIAAKEFIILGVANQWTDKKGLNTFFELSLFLQAPYQILLVGIPQKECPNNIIAVPSMENMQELVELYNCADVLLIASKEDTFNSVAIEAMACGTPVIAYRTTAGEEVINPDTGILLNDFKIEELLIAIENIRENGKRKYAVKCVERVRNNFSNTKMMQDYIDLYKRILEESKNSPIHKGGHI